MPGKEIYKPLVLEFSKLILSDFPQKVSVPNFVDGFNSKYGYGYQKKPKEKISPEALSKTKRLSCTTAAMYMGIWYYLFYGEEPTFYVEVDYTEISERVDAKDLHILLLIQSAFYHLANAGNQNGTKMELRAKLPAKQPETLVERKPIGGIIPFAIRSHKLWGLASDEERRLEATYFNTASSAGLDFSDSFLPSIRQCLLGSAVTY